MSVMWVAPDSTDKLLFYEKIKNATGIKIEAVDSSNTKITFPDGENITINYRTTAELGSTSTWRALVDVDKHLLIIYNNISIGYDIGIRGQLYNMVEFIIAKSNGKLRRMSTSMSQLNTPDYAESDDSKDTFTIVPVFEGSTTYGFYDDIYINYERRFQTGLKFVDENGNEFVTLGGYLLYKNN